MALTEREQQVLRDLEQQLHSEDPSLAQTMDRVETVGRPSPRHIGAGVALVLVGLTVVVAGVAVGHGPVSIGLGVAGFALAVWGVTLMLTRVGSPKSSSPSSGSRRTSSFMDRQAERWERRRDTER
ncbi:DUF3040 domain-containing protein [Actinomyces howellii]|uniref:Protein of uncharacterized function (DUF3040) n=1 Tax=Actinomyces howellii TaxID=52771 RepID=A0A448HF45_9ACTO|nr:DUF3040 domain-containing protein [Actinomyces howellii]VEG26862.1 Protein of uncharacterised function (DUF3040) [Actinomyces howellii]